MEKAYVIVVHFNLSGKEAQRMAAKVKKVDIVAVAVVVVVAAVSFVAKNRK